MAEATATPRVVKTLKITIGATSYSRHVNSFVITPNTPVQQWKGGTPDATFSDVGSPTFQAAIGVVHDYDNPDSFYNFLLEHAGEQGEVEFNPNEGAFTATSTLTFVMPQIGGQVDQFNSSTITMPATKPVVVLA